MFNDRYGLTQAVLDGRKTMTRRIIKGDYENIAVLPLHPNGFSYVVGYNGNIMGNSAIELHPFQVGEIVAVAQRYKDIYPNADFEMVGNEFMTETAGWNNKMFVKADLMPHRTRITRIKVERLQDISDVDAIKEGIYDANDFMNPGAYTYFGSTNTYKTPHAAFASLIDRISGKGTWECNPWVYAYEFELIK